MKKLYRKSTVHPSPPIISDHLSFLPVAILTLAAALSPEDKEVLAYLLSCSSSSSSSDNYTTTKKYRSPPSSSNGTVLLNHTSPLFNCSCFDCYMSYWVRWDSSPNRQLIHEIIDAYEEDELLLTNNNNKNNDKKKIKTKTKSKKDRKNNKGGSRNKGSSSSSSSSSTVVAELGTELTRGKGELGTTESGSVDRIITGGGGDGVEEVNNKGGSSSSSSSSSSVRSFMGFVGEKIWGVIWN